MGHTNHENDQLIVVNFVYHPVAADADSPEAPQTALQHTARERTLAKAVDGVNDARAVRGGIRRDMRKPLPSSCAELQLELGADPDAVDDEGRTPMDYAMLNKNLHGLPEVRRLLIGGVEGVRQ